MRAKLAIPDHVAELIRGLHPDIKRKVRSALESVVDDPLIGKALKDELDGLRSIRVARFRVIYRIREGRAIEVVSVGPRKSIYEETLRLLRRDER